jgi:hypothetical protein
MSLGSKAHSASQKIFNSKLISMKTKLQLYWTTIWPVIKYASETWIPKESMKRKLLITERNILKRIFEPTNYGDGTWRIKTNDEIHNLIKGRI